MSQPITLQSALTPQLLKSVLPNSLLKEIMTDGLIPRGSIADLNARKSQGCWNLSPTTENLPMPNIYGIVMNVSPAYNFTLQIVVRDYSNIIYYRICWAGEWRPWYYVTATAMS